MYDVWSQLHASIPTFKFWLSSWIFKNIWHPFSWGCWCKGFVDRASQFPGFQAVNSLHPFVWVLVCWLRCCFCSLFLQQLCHLHDQLELVCWELRGNWSSSAIDCSFPKLLEKWLLLSEWGKCKTKVCYFTLVFLLLSVEFFHLI